VSEFITALALMFAIEGLCFAAFPATMRRAMQDVATTPEGILRILGLMAAFFGLVLAWVSKGFPLPYFW
jgi:uncharacterized protein